MKTKIYTILAVALMMAGCSSNDEGGSNGGSGSSGALLKSSSGWEKVGTIPYTAEHLGFEGSQAMTPYDLTSVGGQLALIYSEDSKLTGVQNNNCYKVKIAPNTGVLTESTPLHYGGFSYFTNTRFIPGSFTPVYMKIDNDNSSQIYVCSVGSEESGFIAGNNLGYGFPTAPINWYPDGGLTMSIKGSAANGNISDALSYMYPNVGNFEVVENQWSLDPTHWTQTSALRLSGGEINQFIMSYEGSKLYFSIIKDDPSYVPTGGLGAQHNFIMLARQEIIGLSPNNSIIATNVVNDKYTVLIGEADAGSGQYPVITKVHCYQWQKGSDTFTKLYGDIEVPEDVGANLMARNSIGERPVLGLGVPVKFTPDNTAYMLYNYATNNESYTALATMNASGTKIMGKYAASDYPDLYYQQIGLGVCEYHNGAYYAVVFQRKEVLYDYDNDKFRMEIVKLVP